MDRKVFSTLKLPANVRAAIARARTPSFARNFDHEVPGNPRRKIPWPKRPQIPKGIGYLPDDGPLSRAQWGALKRKAMISRAKLGRFAKGHIASSLIREFDAFDPKCHGGEIDLGPPVGKERFWEE